MILLAILGYLAVVVVLSVLITQNDASENKFRAFIKNLEITSMWGPFLIVVGYLFVKHKLLGKTI